MTQEIIEASKDLANLNSEITRLRRLLDRAEIEDRDGLLTRLYGLERDAYALRSSLCKNPTRRTLDHV